MQGLDDEMLLQGLIVVVLIDLTDGKVRYIPHARLALQVKVVALVVGLLALDFLFWATHVLHIFR